MTAIAAAPSTALGRGAAVAAMVTSAGCWGLATVMTKGALADLPPFTLLAIQLGASVAFLWAAVAALRHRLPPHTRGMGRAALPGLLEPGLAYGLGVPGLMLTSAANTSVISTAEPAFVCALAWLLLGQRPGARATAALLVGTAGVALVTAPGAAGLGRGHAAGDLLVLAGTLSAALYVVASSRSVAAVAPLPLAALQQTAGLLFSLLLLAGAWASGLEALPAAVPPGTLLLAVASGVVQYALAFWLYLAGLKVLPPNAAALFLTLTPVFGVGGAMLFLGESVAPAQWLGCAAILAALVAAAGRGGSTP